VLLAQLRLAGIGPFDDMTISFADRPGGMPRRLTVLFGGDGVGKTSILSAIASTRPGHSVAQLQGQRDAPPSGAAGLSGRTSPGPPFVVADWILGDDDEARPHPLRIVSPNAKLDEPEGVAQLRRREQTLFDRHATEGGFVLVAFSGARWFSRTPVLLTTPDRTLWRHDVRTAATFDDATRADLARETKQVLAGISIAAALSARGGKAAARRFEAMEHSMREVLAAFLDDLGFQYLGVDPIRIEPIFATGDGRQVTFDDLPRGSRHLISFGALAIRALGAAYPDKDLRGAEGVVLLDDIEVQQEIHLQRQVAAMLVRALPRVQWIVTTSSPAVAQACDASELFALRRMPESGRVELHDGAAAVMH
jgi:hypothetical protein